MTSLSEEDKQKVFFYANEYARFYDLVEEMVQPHIELIHSTMADLVAYSVQTNREREAGRTVYILDVASGTGAEAFRLLERFDRCHIVAVDCSPAMNQEFQRKFAERYPGRRFKDWVTLIEADFFSDECRPSRLSSLLPGNGQTRGFDAVVAGFFLNHYSLETNRIFYERTLETLRKKGVLVLADGFNFESRTLTEFAHDYGTKWIQKQFRNPEEHLLENLNTLGEDAEQLLELWVEHWNTAHTYAPCVLNRKKDETDAKDTTVSHADMALQAGYREVGFPFRLWEAAVLWARK